MAVHPAKSHFTEPAASSVVVTETPFNKRHCCWFCGEPNQLSFIFPVNHSLSCPHPVLSVPACKECLLLGNKSPNSSIWAVKGFVKRQLLKRYAKDLAIGINWTEQELANSEFEQGNFAGFARSAWFMYEVAKGRVNYLGWPLIANGIELEEVDFDLVEVETFNFDGVTYPSISDAINHFSKVFLLDESYLLAVLQYMADGNVDEKSFAQAVRFCRLLVNATPIERKVAFRSLVTNN